MTTTPPKLRPKERFHALLLPFFAGQGFAFRKSQNKYVRAVAGGQDIVFVSFLTYGSLVKAQLSWGLKFDGLETSYSSVKNWPAKVDTGFSFGLELNHHPEIRFTQPLIHLPLYDTNGEATDSILQESAAKLIGAFQTYADPFLVKYRDLALLESELNRMPIENLYYVHWQDLRILFGLQLAKRFKRAGLPALVKAYEAYIETRNASREQLSKFLNDAIEYVGGL